MDAWVRIRLLADRRGLVCSGQAGDVRAVPAGWAELLVANGEAEYAEEAPLSHSPTLPLSTGVSPWLVDGVQPP